jgi:HlyD family secretion protein
VSQPNTSTLKVAESNSALDSKPSIDDRVRSLKIAKGDRIDSQRPSTKLPWVICLALLTVSGWLAFRDKQLMARFGLLVSSKDSESESSTSTDKPKTDMPSVDNKSAANKSNPTSIAASNGPKTSEPNPKSVSSNAVHPSSTAPNTIALESRGYVIAKHQVLVSPQVSGRIMSLNIEEGRRVVKGEILAEIERTEYQADAEQTRAALMRSKAELSELETGARPQEIAGATADLQEQEELISQLESQYNRLKQALPTNAISMTEFEQAQSSFYSTRRRVEKLKQSLDMMKEGPRKERIEVARAAVIQAEANLTKSQWRLDNCTIRAPIAGTILKKNAEQGNLVNPIAFNGSFSVCDIADLSDLEVDLNIQERDVSKVFANQECEVRSEAFPKRVYKATVSRLMPIADRAKGAVPVRVAVKVPENEQGVYLKPEMSAIVVFYADPSS